MYLNKLKLPLILTVLFALSMNNTACRRDEPDPNALAPEHATGIDMCLTEDPEPDTTAAIVSGGVDERAVGARGLFWPRGALLTVRFMGGTPLIRERVKYYAKFWQTYANVGFQFVTSGPSDIRVAFHQDSGYWSVLGVKAKEIASEKPTMNLALNDFSSESTVKRKTLHEFGHALGLCHEHQSPVAKINWNHAAVYAYYILNHGWDINKVNNQVLYKWDQTSTYYTDYDSKSIMHYPIDAALTTDGYAVPWNTEVSEKDKAFIHQMYTKEGITIRHKAAYTTNQIRFKVNGIAYILKPDEAIKVYVPASSLPAQVSIEESDNGVDWIWDSSHTIKSNVNHNIVNDGSNFRYKITPLRY